MAAAIWAFIAGVVDPLVVKVMVAAGIGFTVYSGIDLGIATVETFIQNQFAGMPSSILAFVGILKLDTALAMILAAYSARFAVQATAGALTRVGFGRAGNSVGV